MGTDLCDDIFKEKREKFRKDFDKTLEIFKIELNKYRDDNEDPNDNNKVIKIKKTR